MPYLLPCPVCGAALQELAVDAHLAWHSLTGTLNGWTTSAAADRLTVASFRLKEDDAPTAKLPPITDTVRRRPPPPVVRELSERVELLRALVQELADYDGPQEP